MMFEKFIGLLRVYRYADLHRIVGAPRMPRFYQMIGGSVGLSILLDLPGFVNLSIDDVG